MFKEATLTKYQIKILNAGELETWLEGEMGIVSAVKLNLKVVGSWPSSELCLDNPWQDTEIAGGTVA